MAQREDAPHRSWWMRNRRAGVLPLVATTALVLAALVPAGSAAVASPGDRVDLRVLVVDDGGPSTTAMIGELGAEGVPATVVSLASPSRPTITSAFLGSGSEAFFEGVVLPNDAGGTLSAAELAALHTYEARFGVRQVDMYSWPGASLGLVAVWSGNGDGMTATVNAAGRSAGFGYLSGPVPFDSGSWTYLATPTSPLPAGETFTPLVTMPVPSSSVVGSVAGVVAVGGREELVVTAAMNYAQFQFRALGHGIISWVTRGVHLGYQRNYLTFQFDDALGSDATWSPTAKCTPGEDCAGTSSTVAMTAADVDHVVAWEQQRGLQVTLAFNAAAAATSDGVNAAALAEFEKYASSFTWLNHGYQHIFQGCVQNLTVIPWVCQTPLQWVAQADITSEIQQNITAAATLHLPIDRTEYLSGEYSGLEMLPQYSGDNPNFASALTASGITAVAADASRPKEATQRRVGTALTVPRHPVAVFYNTATVAQETSEYNHFYSTEPGSICTSYCIAPLSLTTGFASWIVPTDSAYDLSFILSNDPRPFMLHVSNLTGPDYLGLSLIDAILAKYHTSYDVSAPPVTLSLNQAAQVLARQNTWASTGLGATPTVSAYQLNGSVFLTSPSGTTVPVTVPTGTTVRGDAFGQPYGGERSAWVTVSGSGSTLTLPGGGTGSGGPTAPAAPVIGTATAGSRSATITWAAPANGGSPITRYVITPYVGSVARTPVLVSAPALRATVTGLTNGTAYSFTVAAQNAVGVGPASAHTKVVVPSSRPTRGG